MHQYYFVLKKCTLFKNISESDIENVLKCLNAYKKNYRKGEIVRHPETEVTEIGIVVSGLVYVTKISYCGNRIILRETSAGGTFGESLAFTTSSSNPISIVAAQDTAVIYLPAKRIFGSCHFEPMLHMRIMENTAQLLAEKNMLLQMKNDILSQKTTREKLLLYFEYQSKTVSSKAFKIHFSREELADFLSLNTSALSRELSKMQSEGVLSYKKNRFVLNTTESIL